MRLENGYTGTLTFTNICKSNVISLLYKVSDKPMQPMLFHFLIFYFIDENFIFNSEGQ